ncbi:uncharacterized protein LOC115725655 isoform X2 [Cannabis sativa]|uniref:uncharacterized protein LOC115725655 isoform X2 n=1 Tax=Cannabis sativa TaxID=3483 RepID=UPI0029C9F6CC|nr:uncharacterized protein LOC115725655 isoform X2 [Cannabis sativa]
MAEVVDEIRDGKCLLAADTDKKETDISYDEEEDDDGYDSQDDNDYILVEDERITKSRENKAKLPPNTKFSYYSDEDDEFEQDWAIVHKQLLETDGANLELREIINVLSKMVGGLYFALTLQCTDGKYYEVKVLTLGPKIDLEMFRPAKHYPRPTTTTTTTSSEEEEEKESVC